jgi:hypothetical protein
MLGNGILASTLRQKVGRGSDQMLGNGIYVSTNIIQLVADEVHRTFPRTAVWQVVTPMSIVTLDRQRKY